MDGSIQLRSEERRSLLLEVRRGTDPQQRLRAHVLLLLADGWTWNVIVAVLFTSTSTINRWRRRFHKERLAALQAIEPRRSRLGGFWIALLIRCVTLQTPLDFGFLRSRWSCDTVVVLLREDHGVQVGRETVRRWLHQENRVWRRPRPVLGPKDPQRAAKLRKIKALLGELPADEIAVSRTKWTSTPTRRSAPCGCGVANKRKL